MHIIERTLNDITVLDLDGNLVIGGNKEFRQRVTRIINSDVRKLIVNLARVEYMDSSGLGELISGYTAMQRVSGHFKLLHLSHRLQQLLVITKLITVFEPFYTGPAAVSSFTPPTRKKKGINVAKRKRPNFNS